MNKKYKTIRIQHFFFQIFTVYVMQIYRNIRILKTNNKLSKQKMF